MNQVIGDGIVALFGAPMAHEDHAVRACHAALRMQQALDALRGASCTSGGAPAAHPRSASTPGEVLVRAMGSGPGHGLTAVGASTHLAASHGATRPPGAPSS